MLIDFVVLACVVAAVVIWCFRVGRLPLLIVTIGGIVGAAYGVWIGRWQVGAGVPLFAVLLLLLLVIGRRYFAGRGVPVLSGGLALLLAALPAVLIYAFPIADLPKPDGQYKVGVRTFELRDPERLGVMAAAPDAPRRLLVRVWYPADATALDADAAPAAYFSDLEAQTTATALGESLSFPPLISHLKLVSTNSYTDAPLLDTRAPLPVVIYSHGFGSFLAQNTALMEHLASHGYAVYSIQHTYDSAPTVFPNGDVLPTDPALLAPPSDESGSEEGVPPFIGVPDTAERFVSRIADQQRAYGENSRLAVVSAQTWFDDVRFVLDQLQAGAVPQTVREIVAASTFEKVAVTGMSFGGSTAGGVCWVDRRCAVGINMDGLDYHIAGFGKTMPVPFLLLHGDLKEFSELLGLPSENDPQSFNEFSYGRYEREDRQTNIERHSIKGALHLGYSDFMLFLRRPFRDSLLGSTPADVMISLQNKMVKGFIDQHLLGRQETATGSLTEEEKEWVLPISDDAVPDWWESLSEPERARVEAQIEALDTVWE
ncbi:MAG: hypothetical protein AAF668_15605 [Pseudomonadota bacterium]